MPTVQVSGVSTDLQLKVEAYASKHDISTPAAWRELARRGLQSVEVAENDA